MTRKKVISWVLTVLPIAVSVCFWPFISDPAALIQWAQGQNFVVILLLPVVQVAAFPAHNFTMSLFAGHIFGPWWGFLYSYLGWLIGASLAFAFHRQMWRLRGGVVAGRFLDVRTILEDGDGWLLVSLGALVPLISDDGLVIGIAATGILSYRRFWLAFALGTIPGKLATAFLGEGTKDIVHWIFSGGAWTSHCWAGIILMSAYLAIGFAIGYRERVQIRGLNHIIFNR